MTPDHMLPGSAPLLATRLGCKDIPALDLRTQCAAMLYAFQVADSLLASGAARRILIVGAEAHAPLMPWRDWDVLEGTSDRRPSAEAWERATRHRGWAIIFGDGAGALVVERSESARRRSARDRPPGRRPLRAVAVHSHRISRASVSCRRRAEDDRRSSTWTVAKCSNTPSSSFPARSKPSAIAPASSLSDVDWFVAHQANQRINEAVCDRLGVPIEKMPSNIDRLGNTSGATIPILLDEMRRDGRLKHGQLVCVLALGAGFHWGASLPRFRHLSAAHLKLIVCETVPGSPLNGATFARLNAVTMHVPSSFRRTERRR